MPPPSSTSSDDDALLDSLEASTENDPTLQHLRAARLQQLATALKRAQHQRALGFGTYTTIPSEKTLMEITTSTKHCIVHFSKPDFNRCRIMDGHLSALASRHLTARFLTMDVQHAPFLVAKLDVRVLPCVIAFVGGVSAERIVGFEGLGGGGDGFETGDLERRLVRAGALEEGEKGVGDVGGVKGRSEEGRVEGDGGKDGDEDDDEEWD